MTQQPIALSAIMVAGTVRSRAQKVMDRLCSQSLADRMEIIVIDLAADTHPPLRGSGSAPVVTVGLPNTTSWGKARAEGVRRAGAPVVAFIEDHCFPSHTWAERVIEAHQGTWVAVGYAFTNANPQSYVSRGAMMSDYGFWQHPTVSGPAGAIQSNNISFKREFLMEFGEQLEPLLFSDCVIQEIVNQRGLGMFLEARALAAHHNLTILSELLEENFSHSRIVGAIRAKAFSWSLGRRIAFTCATPFVAPVIRLTRLAASLQGRRLWRPFVQVFPIILMAYAASGLGEAVGYLLGLGQAGDQLRAVLLETERATPK